jgi:hypothetical protein
MFSSFITTETIEFQQMARFATNVEVRFLNIHSFTLQAALFFVSILLTKTDSNKKPLHCCPGCLPSPTEEKNGNTIQKVQIFVHPEKLQKQLNDFQ